VLALGDGSVQVRGCRCQLLFVLAVDSAPLPRVPQPRYQSDHTRAVASAGASTAAAHTEMGRHGGGGGGKVGVASVGQKLLRAAAAGDGGILCQAWSSRRRLLLLGCGDGFLRFYSCSNDSLERKLDQMQRPRGECGVGSLRVKGDQVRRTKRATPAQHTLTGEGAQVANALAVCRLPLPPPHTLAARQRQGKARVGGGIGGGGEGGGGEGGSGGGDQACEAHAPAACAGQPANPFATYAFRRFPGGSAEDSSAGAQPAGAHSGGGGGGGCGGGGARSQAEADDFSGDGSRTREAWIVGTLEGSVLVYDSRSLQLLADYSVHEAPVTCVFFFAGLGLLSACTQGRVVLADEDFNMNWERDLPSVLAARARAGLAASAGRRREAQQRGQDRLQQVFGVGVGGAAAAAATARPAACKDLSKDKDYSRQKAAMAAAAAAAAAATEEAQAAAMEQGRGVHTVYLHPGSAGRRCITEQLGLKHHGGKAQQARGRGRAGARAGAAAEFPGSQSLGPLRRNSAPRTTAAARPWPGPTSTACC
jgi:hypothetical protein